MSQTESPIRTVFDVQRTAIKQGEQAFKQGLAAQRSVNRLALAGLQGQESLQRQSFELAQATTDAYLRAGSSVMDPGAGPDGGRNVDEMFARVKEVHAQFYDALERELDRGTRLFDELSEDYAEVLDQQTDQLLESSQTVEDQSAQNVDEFSRQLHDQLERTRSMQEELESQFDRQSEQAEELLEQQREQAEEFQRRLEEETTSMRREIQRQAEERRREERRRGSPQQTGEEGRARRGSEGTTQVEGGARRGAEAPRSGSQTARSAREFQHIDGLGSTYRERLSEAGIRSIEDLAEADADDVTEAADVSDDLAEKWIEQAGERREE